MNPPTSQDSIVSVRGSVVDVRFDGKLPSIYSVLRAGAKREIVIEVLAQSDAHRRLLYPKPARTDAPG